MGLTSSSTGTKVLNEDIENMKKEVDYEVAIARKSKCRKINSV